MAELQSHAHSSQTTRAASHTSSPSPATEAASKKLNLTDFPPIFVSATHFDTEDLHELEDELVECGAPLTFDLSEARIVISRVLKLRRVKFDLRSRGLWTEEIIESSPFPVAAPPPPPKRRKLASSVSPDAVVLIDDSTTDEENSGSAARTAKSRTNSLQKRQPADDDLVRVVKPEWFSKSKSACRPLPLDQFTVYKGRRVKEKPAPEPGKEGAHHTPVKPITILSGHAPATKPVKPSDIIERAKQDAAALPTQRNDRFGKRRFGHAPTTSMTDATWPAGNNSQYAHLLHESTTEHEDGYSSDLPEMPEWVRKGVKYACQRVSLKDSPNEDFIALLKIIRVARELTNDEIGVRAYSTSIAALTSYPHKISNPREIIALPGCDVKIANLYVEWKNTGKIKAVQDIEADPELKILRLFYDIWGVGPTTAREFYYDKGWRDLDDIVEYGWSTLSRVQQIGVKYYEDFKDPIPRNEVESIGSTIHRHAVRVRDERIQTLLVGGYRRGKAACGDVDIIVSHPDEEQTANIINDIVSSLEDEGWITHTLTLSLNNTKRDQQTLPFKTSSLHGGAGFDSLDKALVVWQDPHWEGEEQEREGNPKAKNPNTHRRVDIIISPWRTVGCAVVGWSGGTTFERDLRRYAKNVKGWKFDSSGVRDRGNGEVVDLEGYHSWEGKVGDEGRAKTVLEAERRVFNGFGLEYREPWERCTN